MMSRLHQEASAISARVDDARWSVGRGGVSTARCVWSGLFLPVAAEGVVRNGFQDGQPLRILVDRVDLRKSFINVRYGSDERRAFHEGAGSRLPMKRISPAIILVAAAAGFLENFKEMNSALVIFASAVHLSEERKAHGVVRVSDRKPLAFPEEPAGGRQKSFTKHHGSDSQRAEQGPAVIQRFPGAAQLAGVKALVIPGSLSVTVEPVRKACYRCFHFCDLCFFHDGDPAAEGFCLIGKNFEVVDRLERQNGFQDTPELTHLFLAMEFHKLFGDGPLCPAQHRPSVA